MPFSHGKDGGVCVFVCFLRHRMFSHHPVGEGLAPPAWFRKAFILRGGFRPAGRPPLPAAAKEAKRRRGCPAVASRLQRSHSRTPFTGVTPTPFRRSSGQPWQRVQNRGGAGRSRFYKQRAGGSGIRPYGGFGELQKREQREGRAPPLRRFRQKKAEQGRHRETKRTKPQNIPGLRPFYPHCARLRSFISCSYSRREASASLDMGRMTKMLKMVIRPMPTSPRSHTKV